MLAADVSLMPFRLILFATPYAASPIRLLMRAPIACQPAAQMPRRRRDFRDSAALRRHHAGGAGMLLAVIFTTPRALRGAPEAASRRGAPSPALSCRFEAPQSAFCFARLLRYVMIAARGASPGSARRCSLAAHAARFSPQFYAMMRSEAAVEAFSAISR